MMCSHPELVPTQWNQPKPESAKMTMCGCGRNASCPVCSYGWGAYPCDCKSTTRYEPEYGFVVTTTGSDSARSEEG